MKTERFPIWEADEYSYPGAFGFVPHLTTYLHGEDAGERPCMLVVPGGGYCYVSPREGELIARKFYGFGFNAFVLTYTVNALMNCPLEKQPMKDLARAVRLIRKRAAEFRIRKDKVVICGFSAGGHLCASLCVHWKELQDERFGGESARPDAAILSYPVITSGPFAHRGSIECLAGKDADAETLEYWSLEKQVTEDTPPCFLWHTATDGSVPVENSEMFAAALRAHNVPYAMHVFSAGHHGLSLADEDWAAGRFCDPYTLEQIERAAEAVKSGKAEASEEVRKMLGISDDEPPAERPAEEPVPEVTVWPELALGWMRKQGIAGTQA